MLQLVNIFLELRLDWVLFALLSVFSLYLVQGWLRKFHKVPYLPKRRWVLLWVLIAVAFLAADAYGHFANLQIQQVLRAFAPLYARETESMGHADISFDTPEDDPRYLALIKTQIEWLKLNPLVHDIYTFRKMKDGRVALVVDSETDYDGNGLYEGEREQRTEIGEVYPDINEEMERAFAGETLFDPEVYTDRWGTWVSAYAPLRDRDGRVESILGVDYSAADWLETIAWRRASALGFVGILVILLISNSGVTAVSEKARDEQKKLIEELTAALENVHVLSGLMPICASCKKIRDDKGYWNQIEEYIQHHSEAQFSHGICPECMAKLYPEFRSGS